jgi:hypothetical protein
MYTHLRYLVHGSLYSTDNTMILTALTLDIPGGWCRADVLTLDMVPHGCTHFRYLVHGCTHLRCLVHG